MLSFPEIFITDCCRLAIILIRVITLEIFTCKLLKSRCVNYI